LCREALRRPTGRPKICPNGNWCRASSPAGDQGGRVRAPHPWDHGPAPPRQAGPRPPDWAELVPELGPEPGDLFITKRQWGAFYGTELDLQLRRRGIDTILLAGISTNVGVESTARDAYERGYEQVFLEDAMAARNPDEHAHTVRMVFARIGRVRSTAEVLAALEAGTAKA
jgi:nicotinamidase-related amidase